MRTHSKIITIASLIIIFAAAAVVGIYFYQNGYNHERLIDKQLITCPDGTQHIITIGEEDAWCEANGHMISNFDLNNLPILQDCRKTARKEDFKDDEPTPETVERTSKTGRILTELTHKQGYTVGRVRHEVYGIPIGYYCSLWFDVAFQKTQLDFTKRPILSSRRSEDLNQAFTFAETDLQNIGWLLFGDTKTNQEIQERYNSAKEKAQCSQSAVPDDCLSAPLKSLPPFADGAITRDVDGRLQLHRYSAKGMSKYSFNYYTISITPQGQLDVQTETIFSIDTGILF